MTHAIVWMVNWSRSGFLRLFVRKAPFEHIMTSDRMPSGPSELVVCLLTDLAPRVIQLGYAR